MNRLYLYPIIVFLFFSLFPILLISRYLVYQTNDDTTILGNHIPMPTVTTSYSSRSTNKINDTNETNDIKIAYVVSLIKCSKGSMTTGFIDAAAVLRHSIHKVSSHYHHNDSNTNSTAFNNPGRQGKYSYEMVAIVHEQCAQHAQALEQLGYKTLLKPSPVQLSEIQGDWYRDHVSSENCCGADEFIKLYAYTLTDYPIFVILDMDVVLLQPFDDLFDSMIFGREHSRGNQAREQIQNHELEYKSDVIPSTIDAFFTRDVTSSKPWEVKEGVQGGFLVARPSNSDFDKYVEIIRKGNYTRGRGDGSGWDSLGYGGFQGAMAFQGLVAYFYDVMKPNTFVELNVCRWNQVVADVHWRGPERYDEFHLKCRRYPRHLNGNQEKNVDCEDCRLLLPNEVKSVHYTACKKPWECKVPHPRVPRDKRQVYRLSHLTNITTCMAYHKEWFNLRMEFEDILSSNSKIRGTNDIIISDRKGTYEKESFLGYCERDGGYIPMKEIPGSTNVNELYKYK